MSQPNEKDLARFQAQLALALLKRQLHEGDHLSAEQLAQLITHTAPPDSAVQWKQHLIDCQDCYAVFLDVAQLQLEQQSVSATATKKSWWLQWRYAMVAVLPMVLVAMLYFGLPQQSVELQRTVVDGAPAVQFDYKKREDSDNDAAPAEIAAQPKSAPVLREEKIAEAISVPAAPAPTTAELATSADAAPEPVLDSVALNQAAQEPQRINNPLISAQANEREQEAEADRLRKRESVSRSAETFVASEPVAKAESPPSAAGAAETIEVVGARVGAVDLACEEPCSADERFEQALQKWIDDTQTKCREQKLNVLQTRQKWRELLDRHQVAKRDELAKQEEPNKAEGWCEFSLKLQQKN